MTTSSNPNAIDVGAGRFVELQGDKEFSFAGNVCAIYLRERGKQEASLIGTAFLIAQLSDHAIFVSARHVFESADANQSFDWNDPDSGQQWELFVMLPRKTPMRRYHGHPVKQVAVSSEMSDAALLLVDVHETPELERQDWWTVRLDLNRPVVGDDYLLLGWTRSAPNRIALIAAEGTVEVFYPSGIAPGQYKPFPCMQVSFRVPSGVSGGPVVSKRSGGVIGFVSGGTGGSTNPAGLQNAEPDTDWVGWAQHIGSISRLDLDSPEEPGVEVNLQALINSGLRVIPFNGTVSMTQTPEALTIFWNEPAGYN